MTTEKCEWTQEDDWDNCENYLTECGKEFRVIDSTPKNNGMEYCCFCGKLLEQILYESPCII